jgi:hypothetical protein
MKFRCYYKNVQLTDDIAAPKIRAASQFIDQNGIPLIEHPVPFASCFLSECLSSTWLSSIIAQLGQLESGNIEHFEESTNGHFAEFRKGGVIIGRQISKRWLDVKQEEWQTTYSLTAAAAAFRGWQQFLEMPRSIETELIVEV